MCSIHMYILYWIYSVNNYAVFVYFLCCVTAFVTLGAKPPKAKFAASTFSRGPICRGPICLEPFFSSDPLSVDILSFIRKVFKLIKVEAFFGILKFAIGLRILYFVWTGNKFHKTLSGSTRLIHWHKFSSDEKCTSFLWLLLMQSVCLSACFYIPLMLTTRWLFLYLHFFDILNNDFVWFNTVVTLNDSALLWNIPFTNFQLLLLQMVPSAMQNCMSFQGLPISI